MFPYQMHPKFGNTPMIFAGLNLRLPLQEQHYAALVQIQQLLSSSGHRGHYIEQRIYPESEPG